MTKRLFIAIKIEASETLLDIFSDIKTSLRSSRITWVDINNLHLTFKFLGDTDTDIISDLLHITNDISDKHTPFDISISNLGLFGSHYDPKVIWAGIRKNDTLLNIHSELNAQLKSLNIYPDRQNFVPHLTIGRIKGQVDKDVLTDIISDYKDTFIQKSRIEKVSLYESILRPNGPLYIELT